MGSGNILTHLGNQKDTEHSYASIINALEAQKAHLNNIGASINGIIERSEQRALERQRLQNENNANIQKAYAEKEWSSYLRKLESAQKDEKGNALPQEQQRIDKELAQERAAFYKENGYANTTHRGIIGQIVERFSTPQQAQESTQSSTQNTNAGQNQNNNANATNQKPQELTKAKNQDNTTAIIGQAVEGSKI